MDLELKETDIWGLYESHLLFMNRKGYFAKTDRNFRFFNGDQWEGVVLKKTEPIQVNFIKPIVKYKVGVVTSTDYALIYNSENYDNEEFREVAKKASELVTKKAQKVWEINKIDTKLKKCVKKSAINGEAITYFYWDNKKRVPIMELKSKVDAMYGNENDDDIQEQPYILLKKRVTLSQAREYAKNKGVKEEDIDAIHADNFTQNESGNDSKEEETEMVTIVTKLYKKN